MNTKYSNKTLQSLAEKNGGRCLNEYVSYKTKYLWECANGHRWEAKLETVMGVGKRKPVWCGRCSGRIQTIEDLQQHASALNGKCLSSEFKRKKDKYLWECAEGHRWMATWNNVFHHNSWCNICSTKKGAAKLVKYTIDDMQKVAKQRGGKCLSLKFSSVNNKLLWECALGHQWKASYNNIEKGKWCRECSKGLYERICRAYFEQIFNKPFPSVWNLSWLVNPKSGRKLELDGYNEEIKLAFEHHGEQHYTTNTRYGQSKNDLLKQRLCAENGVNLIVIPELTTRLPLKELSAFIEKELKNIDIQPPVSPTSLKIDLKNYFSPDKMHELQKVAKEKGGKCVSQVYLGARENLFWECAKGHRWEATPDNVKRGTWCPDCVNENQKKHTIEELRALAIEREGKCHSSEYLGVSAKYRWECTRGHQWEATGDQVLRGSWCIKCAAIERNKKLGRWNTTETMREIAIQRGGKCLSENHTGANKKYLWECARGHQWEAVFHAVKRGTWCPKCAIINRKNKKKSQIKAREFA